MPAFSSPVTLEELEGSPKFQFSKDGASATRTCKMNWSQIQAMVDSYFGQTIPAGRGVLRFNQASMPGFPQMVVETIGIEPFDDVAATYSAGGAITHTYARVTINYKTVPWDRDENNKSDDPDRPEGTYLTHTVTHGSEMMTLPAAGWKWQGSGKKLPDDMNVGMLIPTEEHSFSWKSVPKPPFNSITDLVGKVNSVSFSGKAAETMMFIGATASRQMTTDGTRAWTLDYKFSGRAIKHAGGTAGWNHLFNPETGQWEKPITVAGGNTIYQTGSMGSLFEFEAEAV